MIERSAMSMKLRNQRVIIAYPSNITLSEGKHLVQSFESCDMSNLMCTLATISQNLYGRKEAATSDGIDSPTAEPIIPNQSIKYSMGVTSCSGRIFSSTSEVLQG